MPLVDLLPHIPNSPAGNTYLNTMQAGGTSMPNLSPIMQQYGGTSGNPIKEAAASPSAFGTYGTAPDNGSGHYLSPNASWNNMLAQSAPQGQQMAAERPDLKNPNSPMPSGEVAAGNTGMVNGGPIVNSGIGLSNTALAPSTGPTAAPVPTVASAPMSTSALMGEQVAMSSATGGLLSGGGGMGGDSGGAEAAASESGGTGDSGG